MKKQAKAKLPKVWVALDENGVTWCGHDRDYADHAGFTLHQYTPVQPPRRCVWGWDQTTEFWESGCLNATSRPPEKFCPYCGGRIVRRVK